MTSWTLPKNILFAENGYFKDLIQGWSPNMIDAITYEK